ncbi:MAG: hypothetical protein CVU11_16385 [Bacteroidetes bacterium HGW-Bacteroidetes-6]|jgi:hypothetical protein|nr:MAG: hypothetical protein CVU11_16385 [Bacteroidetes bacterium HGW-Bacteroidetes-6]
MNEDTSGQTFNWVTLSNFTYPHEYMMLVSFLKSNGITVFSRNETLVSVDPFLSNAVGGIDLMVPDTQLDEARILFEKFNSVDINVDEELDDPDSV